MRKIQNWGLFWGKKRAKLEERVIKGIPDAARSRAWQFITDPETYDPTSKNQFNDPKIFASRPTVQSYVDQGRDERFCAVIDVDLHRTYSDVCRMFSKPETLLSLQNILIAYSNVDKEVGYCQGMGFYAGMLLIYMPERDAFYSFKAIMQDPRYDVRQYFLPGFPKFHKAVKVFLVAVKSYFSDVYKASFQPYEMELTTSLTDWFLCAFQTSQLQTPLRLMLFERFLMFQFRALLSFGLTIIALNRDFFKKAPFEELFPALKKPEKTEGMKDWRKVIATWNDLWLTEKKYKKFFKLAGVEYFT